MMNIRLSSLSLRICLSTSVFYNVFIDKKFIPTINTVTCDFDFLNNTNKSSPNYISKVQGYSYNANKPCEDRFSTYRNSNTDDTIGFVLDGHGGWQVSNYVSSRILKLLHDNILSLDPNKDIILIQERIKAIFNELENSYIQSIQAGYNLGYGEVAKVGTCALFAVKKDRNLIIGNCGDCRAVIGTVSPNDDSRYYATRITMDHNCREPLEALKLMKSHPNESNIIVCKSSTACYVKGRLQLTRALGDIYLKYNEFNAPLTQHSRLLDFLIRFLYIIK